jgi:cysteine desulfurase / selenocysteine lyase
MAQGRDWRNQFPILQSWTYFDHATFGPTPMTNVRASQDAARKMSELPIADIGGSASMEQLRGEGAGLLRCRPDNVALLKCTSEGIDLVAQGIDWRQGDEVLCYEKDFPGTLAPWTALQARGVVVRMVRDLDRSRFEVADVEALITDRTRVICFSLVNADHGFRAPAAEITALARPRGIWVAVDAVQAVGCLDIDVESLGADVVAAHGYKFLLSGFGVALVYCSPRAVAELNPPQIGWKNSPGAGPIGIPVTADGARRFESSVAAIPVVAGMRASIALLQSVGLANIEARVRAVVEEVAEAASAKGYRIRSSRLAGEGSAVLSIRHPSLATTSVHEALHEAHVACALRNDAIRIAPHFYNSAADVAKLVDALPT